MPGQPSNPPFLTFDVTSLTALEPGTPGEPTTTIAPTNILDKDEVFQLQAQFTASGIYWNYIESSTSYKARFYAESFGTPTEVDFPEVTGTVGSLVKAGNTYTLTAEDLSISEEGLYKCAVAITFFETGNPANGLQATVGYSEDLILQINELED
jgi:hypothetical protein